jgi:DNA-binding beta-propeller fold protein YncE
MAFVITAFAISPFPVRASTLGTLETTYNFHASGLLADPQRPYVFATNGSQLEVINTNTLAISGSVQLPGQGSGMAMSSDGSKLYIGALSGVFVVDAQTDTLQSTLSLGYPVTQLAAGLQNRLYVLGPSKLAEVDATTGASAGPDLLSYTYLART